MKGVFKIIFLAIFLPLISFAIELKPIKLPFIQFANVSYNEEADMLYGFAKVYNATDKEIKPNITLSFLRENDSREILRLAAEDAEKIKANSTSEIPVRIRGLKDKLPSGRYNITIALHLPKLGAVSVKDAGKLTFKSSAELASLDCRVLSGEYKNRVLPINCKSDKALDNIKYTIYQIGQTHKILSSEFVELYGKQKEFSFKINIPKIAQGPIDILVQSAGETKSTESRMRFIVPGSFTKIVNLDFKGDKIDLYLNGTNYQKNRRILTGLIKGRDLCFFKDLNLYSIAPVRRAISVDKDCAGANVFAVVYLKSGDSIKTEDIIDMYNVNRQVALSILNNNVYKVGTKNKSDMYIKYGMLSAFALVLLAVLTALWLNRSKTATVTIAIFALAFGAFGALFNFARAEVFDSLDAPKARFEVNFPNINKEVGQNDNIVFSFSALDNFNGAVSKYPGTEAYVWIDNDVNNKVKIMSATDNNPTVLVSLPHSLSLGTHTLHFEIPASVGVCGAAFDFSVFDQNSSGTPTVFDPVPCNFSVDFQVVSGSALSLVFYAQPKAIPRGSTTKLYWFTVGANSCTASGDWSGDKALNNTSGETTNPISTDFAKFTLTCSNGTDSISRSDTVYTYICGDNICSQWEDCNLCSADCSCIGTAVQQSIKITADPQIVRKGDKSVITWITTGYDSCTISEDNPTINDSWTRLAGQESTSPLSTDTIYTITCTDGLSTGSKSVKVRVAPEWLEI